MQNRLPDIDLPVDFIAGVDITHELLGLYRFPCKIKAGIFVLCLDGSVEASINLNDYHIKKNDFITITPGSVIQIKDLSRDMKLSVAGFSYSFMGGVNLFRSTMDLLPVIVENPVLSLSDDVADVYKDYFALLSKAFEREMLTHPEILRCILQSTLYGIGSGYKSHTENNHILTRSEEIYKQLMRLIMLHYTTERRVSFYAEELRLSSQHLCMTIKQQTGQTVSDLIAQMVIMDAKAQLKSTNLSVKEIALALSFPNVSFFGKYFKRYVGVGPLEYRNN